MRPIEWPGKHKQQKYAEENAEIARIEYEKTVEAKAAIEDIRRALSQCQSK